MYNLTRNAFPSEYLFTLKTSLLSSQYLGKSPLGVEFVNTKGFSLVFRRSALSEVFKEFAYLRIFLESTIFPKSNAFYVNPLVLCGTSRVDAHVDCRLVMTENVRIIPNLVSILYVHVDDEMIGGDLTLGVGTENEITINPKTNDLVHFLGKLVHSVGEVRGDYTRVSLVCEQYNLPAPILAGFPDFKILCNEDLAPRVPLQ